MEMVQNGTHINHFPKPKLIGFKKLYQMQESLQLKNLVLSSDSEVVTRMLVALS